LNSRQYRNLIALSPLSRLRFLCAAAAAFHLAGVALLLAETLAAVVFQTLLMGIVITLANIAGVALLHRPARLFFPFTALYQFALIAHATPDHSPLLIPELILAGVLALGVAILIFTSPTKDLFFQADPDAPVR
jgi:hypothetical protein